MNKIRDICNGSHHAARTPSNQAPSNHGPPYQSRRRARERKACLVGGGGAAIMGAPESSRGGRIKGLFNVSCMSVGFVRCRCIRCLPAGREVCVARLMMKLFAVNVELMDVP